jgi:hypothetical protein
VPSPEDGGTDAGRTDAGYDAGVSDGGCTAVTPCTERLNACGLKCGCIGDFLPDGGFTMVPYCDPDIGNPCPLGCFNPKEADGGRRTRDDAGNPLCFC